MGLFKPSHGLENALEAAPEMGEGLNAIANEVAAVAQTLAPVDTGAYQSSIHAEGRQIIADVDYAVYVELGTSDTPAFHTLATALEASGLKRQGG